VLMIEGKRSRSEEGFRMIVFGVWRWAQGVGGMLRGGTLGHESRGGVNYFEAGRNRARGGGGKISSMDLRHSHGKIGRPEAGQIKEQKKEFC